MCQNSPHLAHPVFFSLSHLCFLSAFFIPWKEEGHSSRQEGQRWGRLAGWVCMCACTDHWKRVGGGAMSGLAFFCVCVHTFPGGGVVDNLCGRKWRLMIMRTMLLTTPLPQLCACRDRGNVGVGSPFSAQCVLVN